MVNVRANIMASNVKWIFLLLASLVGMVKTQEQTLDHTMKLQFDSVVEDGLDEKINKLIEEKLQNTIDNTISKLLDSKVNTIIENKLDQISSESNANVQESLIAAHLEQIIEENIDAKVKSALDSRLNVLVEILEARTEPQPQESEMDSRASRGLKQETSKRFVLGPDPYPGGIGFTACVSPPDLQNLGTHHVIVFDKSITNVGNAYHNHTGIFIAPLKGLYVFHMTSMMVPHATQYLQFVKDGQVINYIYPDADQSGDYGISGNLWVMSLDVGSEIWIQMKGPGQIHGNCFTVFSGFMLYELE